MVRGYILTKNDRKVIKRYLEENMAMRRLDMVKHLSKKYYPTLKDDLHLIEKLLEKKKARKELQKASS